MNPDPLLQQAINDLKDDLRGTQEDLRIYTAAVIKLDKELAVLEANVAAKARHHAGWIALVTAIGVKLIDHFLIQ